MFHCCFQARDNVLLFDIALWMFICLGALPGIMKECCGRTRAAITSSAVIHAEQQIMAKMLSVYIYHIYLTLSSLLSVMAINHWNRTWLSLLAWQSSYNFFHILCWMDIFHQQQPEQRQFCPATECADRCTCLQFSFCHMLGVGIIC